MEVKARPSEDTRSLPVIMVPAVNEAVVLLDEPHFCIVMQDGQIYGSYHGRKINLDQICRAASALNLMVDTIEILAECPGFGFTFIEKVNYPQKGADYWINYLKNQPLQGQPLH